MYLLHILISCGNPGWRGRCSVYFFLGPSPQAASALSGGGASDDVGSGGGEFTAGGERKGSFWKSKQVVALYFYAMLHA